MINNEQLGRGGVNQVKQSGSSVYVAVEYIKVHYTQEFDVAMLSRMCYLCESQFTNLFKKAVGMSPIKYKNFLRMERAKELLQEGQYREAEIATMMGFRNINYFCKVFKMYTGVAPSSYQKKITKILDET